MLVDSSYDTPNLKVRVERSRLVKPLYGDDEGADSSPSRALASTPLSVFDKVTYDIQVSLIFAYRPPTPPNLALEFGLRKALALCRTWAGRLANGGDYEDDPVFLLNDEGVGFIEAFADCTLDQALPFSSSTLPLELLHPRSHGVPELAQVQLTRFTCGSLVVGLTHHHLVGDGPSMCKFMLAWSQATRRVEISPPPFRDISIFAPRNPPRFQFDHRGVEYMSSDLQEVYSHDDPIAKDIVMHKVHFPTHFLAKLKAMASSSSLSMNNYKSNDRKPPFSTFESLLAHLWRVLTRARGLGENETTHVRVSVDGRARMNPRIPNYFGNLMLWAFPTSNVRDLLNKPLSHAAELIHEAVSKVNDDYFKSFIDFANHKVKEEDLVPTAAAEKPVLCPGVEVDCWLRFPVNNMDFGTGKPFLFLPDYPPVEGLIFLLPSLQEDGSVDAYVGLFKKNVLPFTQSCYSLPLSCL